MRTFLCWWLFAALPALCATATISQQSSSVTVLLNYEQPHSPQSFRALQQQLQTVLGAVGLKLDVRERQQTAPHEQFSDLFVFRMKGYCSMNALPIGALSDERGALAMAYSADGEILPFGEVECDRIRESLQRVLGRGNPEQYQSAFGSALGLVMAHEIYHMLAHSALHTRQGLTKESLSARELLQGQLSLPEIARLAMRGSVPAQH
ncbi:MAG: hypothetical protein M3Y72_04590 [Acidobacteriota bacterium]|nr:hypothetical protein [Acidobacteriota bacterium]